MDSDYPVARRQGVIARKMVRMSDSYEGLLNTQQAADYLGLSAATLAASRCTTPKQLRRRALAIPYIKLGKRRVGYRLADLKEYIQQNAIMPQPEEVDA